MIIPRGVTLICGGGFHGKSTVLRTLAMGVYDKIQGDGRELCITVYDALSVRAEDGRYVSNCNITAFMSSTSFFMNGHDARKVGNPNQDVITQGDEHYLAFPTNHMFSTKEASGSTSQASNVMEAIEFGATALLIDEDVSAANFMARDGRMRALVKDETITPLLYRVNGLYRTRHISSVIVIGGIGDWLDVPDNVILMDKHYQVNDALQRARSISHQFSYSHIQYGGRGVVHRLEWKKYDDGKNDKMVHHNEESQISWLVVDDINPRDRCIYNAQRFACGNLKLFDGGDGKFSISVYDHPYHNTSIMNIQGEASTVAHETCPEGDNEQISNLSRAQQDQHDDIQNSDEEDENEDDFGTVDLSKCEQIAGKMWQVVGCALAVKWMIQTSAISPNSSIKSLMDTFYV